MSTEALAEFPGMDEFYEYRGHPGSADAPPIWLPVHQGDVFRGVDVPGVEPVEGQESLAMVFMHPCVMRKGAQLADRITVFRVREATRKRKEYASYANHYSVMPLPDLLATGAGVHHGEFQMVGTVQSASLDRSERVMSLTKDGRLLLQQRAIHHFTRLLVPQHDLRGHTRSVEREVELLAAWCEAACDRFGESAEAVADAEVQFDEYLTADDRRHRLSDEDSTVAVVAEVYKQIESRFSAT